MTRCLHTLGLVLLLAAVQAQAAVTVSFRETGGNVEAQASGSLNVGSLGNPADVAVLALLEFVAPGNYAYVVGPSQAAAYAVSFATQQPLHAVAVSFVADASTGSTVGVSAAAGGQSTVLYLPRGYVSGAPLNGTATWNGETFASLGLTPGVYSFNFGADSVEFVVGAAPPPAPVPAGSMVAWLAAVLGMLLLAGRSLPIVQRTTR